MIGLANRITVARAVLTIGIWGMLAYARIHAPTQADPTWWWVLMVLFFVTAVTDILDGYLARRFGDESLFGRVVDPLVDKMLTLGCMILLLGMPWVPDVMHPWMVALMLLREMLVTTLRAVAEARGVAFPAVAIGKLKMFVQCVAVTALLAMPLGWGWLTAEIPPLAFLSTERSPFHLARLLAVLATLLTVLSGVVYLVRAVRALRSPAA